MAYHSALAAVGERLRTAMRVARLTIAAVAERMETSARTVRRYTQGHLPRDAAIRMHFLARFARATGCNLNWLLVGQESIGFATAQPRPESFATKAASNAAALLAIQIVPHHAAVAFAASMATALFHILKP